MARKKFILPSIDLSKYSDPDNIPLNIERILSEALIYFELDIQKTAEYFNASEDIVNTVAIKYYSQIKEAVNNKLENSEYDSSLNDICNIFKKHVTEIKKAQAASDTKSLRSSELTALCKIADRISEIRRLGMDTYKATIVDLSKAILSNKDTEFKINGPVEDNSDYTENQETVLSMLSEFTLTDRRMGSRKPVLLINSKTGETVEYESLKAIAKEFKTSPEYMRRKIDKKTIYKGKYFIKFKKEEDNT